MILKRFLTPASVELHTPQDSYFRSTLLPLAAHGDGHVLAVTVALLLAVLTGRSDLCVAGVFGAGKTRSLAVLLVGRLLGGTDEGSQARPFLSDIDVPSSDRNGGSTTAGFYG